MLAASNGLIKNVKALIAAGADLNARDNEDETPLSYAKENDHDKVVKLLLSYEQSSGLNSARSSSEITTITGTASLWATLDLIHTVASAR